MRLALLLVGMGFLAAAPGIGWYFLWRKADRPAAAERTPSIAVLPFVNLSGEKENEYFSDGMTEELINALANIEGLRVVARTSAFSYKGKNVDVRKVGEELQFRRSWRAACAEMGTSCGSPRSSSRRPTAITAGRRPMIGR